MKNYYQNCKFMRFTFLNLVQFLSLQMRSNMKFVKLFVGIEFTQNIALSLPKHGWGQLQYEDKMLKAISQFTNYTLFLDQADSQYSFDVFIIFFSFLSYIALLFSVMCHQKDAIRYCINYTLTILNKVLKLPLIAIYIEFLFYHSENVGYFVIGCFTFAIFLVLLGLITYFQRDIQCNFNRLNVPIYHFYSPVLFIIHLLDIFRVLVFTILKTNTGQIVFQLLTIMRMILKQHQNIFEQNDQDKSNQSLILCNLFISIFLLVGISTQINETSIFNILLYSSTLIYHLFTQINFAQIFYSSSLQYLIHQKMVEKKIFVCALSCNLDNNYIQNLFEICLQDEINNYTSNLISPKYQSIFQKEDNILILFDFLVKHSQRYYLALNLLYKFESTQTNQSYFYKQISAFLKYKVQKEMVQFNQFTKTIENLNMNKLIEAEYEKKTLEVFQKQIEFLKYLIQGAQSFNEIEKHIIGISETIQGIKLWLKKNNIYKNRDNSLFLKISINFNIQIMQNLIQGIKLNKILNQLLTTDSKTISYTEISKEDSIIVPVSIINKRGSILNSNSQTNQFFGFSSKNTKLETIEQLMPKAIKSIHNEFLEGFINRVHILSNSQQSQLQVLQKQENEYIQCLQIHFILSNDFSDFILLSLIKKVNKNKVFIVFDNSGQITGMSQHLKNYWPEIFQQMQFYNLIQYYCPKLFELLSSQNSSQIFDINFIQRSKIQKIDMSFKSFIRQETNLLKSSYYVDNIYSERSDQMQLLNSKYQNIEQDTLNFNILDVFYQNYLNSIMNIHATESDVIFPAKGLIKKVQLKDEIIQYQLELHFNEISSKNEKVETISDSKRKMEPQKTKSLIEGSEFGTELKAAFLLHQVLLKQTSSVPFIKIYFYKFIVILLIIIFLILQIYQSQNDGQTKIKLTQYIYAPQLMAKVYNDAFQLGFHKLIFQNLETSQFLQNAFITQLDYKLSQIREEYDFLHTELIKIDAIKHEISYSLDILQSRIQLTSIATFSEKIRENMIPLITYSADQIQFIKSILFFRMNIVQAYNISIDILDTFSIQLATYQTNIMEFWNSILAVQLILFIIPFLININNWFKFEKRQKCIIQIITKINEDQAYQLIDQKLCFIKSAIQEKGNMINTLKQSLLSLKTSNLKDFIPQSQNSIKQRQTQTLYEKISNKQISIIPKLSVSIISYLLIAFLVGFGYLQTKLSDQTYQPIEQLIKTYVKFQAQLSYLISFASIMKGQQELLNIIQDIHDAELGNINTLFQDDQVPQSFHNLSQTYSKKVITLFSTIILTNQIDQKDKEILYDLYQGDFCNYLQESIKFCNTNLTQSKFEKEYGQFYGYENNSDVLRTGIIGFISKLDSLLKNNFDLEISKSIYDQNPSGPFYYFKDYNNLIVQFPLNISEGFNQFYEEVNYISSNLITKTMDSLFIFYICFGIFILVIYLIISSIQIRYSQRRYKRCILGLVMLSEDLLNDKTSLYLLKKLMN
ncbi:unnamed protein product (macronuclear) [Paramecium tetraurelia]|uniref:PAS domain-containing protein n=1 Tax=Paramecium tetraurelia TaxID=5888 RepID=A0DGH5_PARTE|nr:uncharacterized protein GSPATT00002271001 [Paramecium tetraurelia]CAK82142.1 unnamed protein product [Paramecium tetraurelia]|eukprot:XP_001449539.1 hypothetical protein (macronuclear) [Paramecium tetraurelia strain d4-2]